MAGQQSFEILFSGLLAVKFYDLSYPEVGSSFVCHPRGYVQIGVGFPDPFPRTLKLPGQMAAPLMVFPE